MADYDLRDLQLAGVAWELCDTPLVSNATVQPSSSATSHEQSAQNRMPTSIVPPIAPIQSISVDVAVSMAARPNDMASLLRMIGEFNHPLRSGATNVVMPSIATNPNGLVVVTDIPSSDDDASGQIMSGASGELLDKMLGAINMTRENVSIVPLIFWRTPGGRTPTRNELDLSRPFVDRVIEMLNPRVILTLGTLAAGEIASAALPRSHGAQIEMPNGRICVPIYHTNYLLLKPAAKRDVWNAIQPLEKLLKSE